MKKEVFVSVINDDYTLRAIHCRVSQLCSETQDGPITHAAVYWYDDEDDAIRGINGQFHFVPIKNILFERGFLDPPKYVPEPKIEVYRIGISEEIRNRVYDRDGRKCVKCGATEDLCLDHKHPFSKGGKTEESNLQTMCRTCNSKKRARIE